MPEESGIENLLKLPEAKAPVIKSPIMDGQEESFKKRIELVERQTLLSELFSTASNLGKYLYQKDALSGEIREPSLDSVSQNLKELKLLDDNRGVLEEESGNPRGLVETLDILNCFFISESLSKRTKNTGIALSTDVANIQSQAEAVKKDFLDFGVSLVDRNMDKIEAVITDDNSTLRDKLCVLKAFSYLVAFKRYTAEDQQSTFGLLINHTRRVLKAFHAYPKENKSVFDLWYIGSILEDILKNSATSMRDEAMVAEVIAKFFEEGDIEERKMVQHLVVDNIVEEPPVGITIRNLIFPQFHLDYTQLVRSWIVSGPPDNIFSISASNTEAIFDLEEEKRGITSSLYSNFGIKDFARYPLRVLINQYEEMEQYDFRPVGLIIYPRTDHNGAFYGSKEMLEHLFSDLDNKARIIVWEVDSQHELISALNKSRHKYGKISFAILNGHGSKDSIGLDTSRRKGSLSTEDLKRKGANALGQAFIEKPTIILGSCSTGDLGGIGEEISKLDATVIAPPEPVSLQSIIPTFLPDGTIEWKVTYIDATGQNVGPATYQIQK